MDDVKFCENNFEYDIESVIEKIEDELTSVKVEVESCLGECTNCSDGPFAMVNGELIKAETAEELFEMIKDKVET